jgi:acetyltransferase
MLASATPEQYASCLRILLADPGVDGVMVILPPPPIQTAGAVAKALIPVIHLAEKPVTIALMGERLIQEAIEHFRAARIPEYRFPERAASALAILADRAEYLARSAGYDERSRSSTPLLKIERLSELIRAVKTRQDLGAEWLDNATTAEILEAYGITVHQTRFARNATEACKIAEQIGFPVAVKIVSPDLPHKSDVGGVLLDLDTSEAVAQGCAVILERVRTIRPDARLEGFNIQPMLLPGQDVIIGAVQDAQFGGLVMFGSGGVEVEGLHDVAFGLAPLNHADALWMIENTWAGRKLRGYRHIPPADLDSVVDALQRLAQITIDFPQISEIEVNPLRALTTKQGAVALDYRARLSVI